MEVPLLLLVLVIVIAVCFDITNGFHDAANAIATVVSTHALSLRTALIMAAAMNLAGAFFATAVAETIQHGLIREVGDPLTSQLFVLAALLGAIAWNLLTWYFGMPSSSSHAIVGGLVGAGLVHGHSPDVIWSAVLGKVILPMLCSPLLGALVAAGLMAVTYALFRNVDLAKNHTLFRRLQIGSAALMALSHGSNDAQKTMGLITLALIGAHWLPAGSAIPWWVILLCAMAMAGGTYLGGKKIIETAGEKITRLDQESGTAANLAGSLTIVLASQFGMPVSTTHVVVGSITGAGAVAHRRRERLRLAEGHQLELNTDVEMELSGGIRWSVWRRMALTWVLTLPGSALVGGLVFATLRSLLV